MKKNLKSLSVAAFMVLPILLIAEDGTRLRLKSQVDPFIGTGSVGHTFPGATAPFGAVQLSPDTNVGGWKWCGGYHASDDSIMGFSHTHTDGTGGLSMCNILFVPQVGEVKWEPGTRPDGKGYRTKYLKDSEEASPGYYKATLANGIQAELTATSRAGMHRYTFPKDSAPAVLIDLWHHNTAKIENSLLAAGCFQESPTIVVGWQNSFYFVAEFSRPVKCEIRETWAPGAKGPTVKVAAIPEASAKPLEIKVGISPTGIDGARKNLVREIGEMGFDQVRASTEKSWEKFLGRISIQTKDESLRRVFFTALYHAMIHPSLFNDVDGKYVGSDGKVYEDPGFNYYSTLSLWDTFRSVHPLFSIILPEMVSPINKSMIDFAAKSKSGMLPKWGILGTDCNAMIGYHAVPVIVDAYNKGFRDFDSKEALRIMVNTAERRTKGEHKTLGYMPCDGVGRPAGVSITLENAYDDWCIAQFATLLGDSKVADEFNRRSERYKNLWHPDHRLMWGKDKEGNWMEPIDVHLASHKYFTEGNALQWMWSVMHDISGLIELIGGNEAAAQRLEELFADQTPVKADSPDVTGLLGQYCQGNEPSHHIAYLFDYLAKPWRTQYWVNRIVRTFYNDTREGLCGNDDCGAMSSWLIFSALGFYPVNPANSVYVVGSPMFERAEIQTPQTGKKFTILAKNLSKEAIYIQSAKLNGQTFDRSWLTHEELTSGGTLEFVMGTEPNKTWGLSGKIPSLAPSRY